MAPEAAPALAAPRGQRGLGDGSGVQTPKIRWEKRVGVEYIVLCKCCKEI